VLDTHHRRLANLAGLGATVGHQHGGQVTDRDAVGRAGAHDLLDVLADPPQRTRFVITSQRHALINVPGPSRFRD